MISEEKLQGLEFDCKAIKHRADCSYLNSDTCSTSISYTTLLDLVSSIRELQKDKVRLDWLHEKTKVDDACQYDNIRDAIDDEMPVKS